MNAAYECKKEANELARQPSVCCCDHQQLGEARCSLPAEFNAYRPSASSITLHRIRTTSGTLKTSIHSSQHRYPDGRGLRTTPTTVDQGLQQRREKKRLAGCTQLPRRIEYSNCKKSGIVVKLKHFVTLVRREFENMFSVFHALTTQDC